MDTNELKRGERELISGCALFEETDGGFVSGALADDRCRLTELRKGDAVLSVYDYRRCLGLVLSGKIAVTKAASSRYVMNTLERGSLFGSADLYDEDDAPVTVLTAVSPCRVVFFPRALVEALLGENAAAARCYIRFLTGRLRFLNDKIQGLVSESAEEALRQYLAANASPDGGAFMVRLGGSVSALAEELNIGRASLYRAFEALERGGLIEKSGKEIRIPDPGGLKDME